MATFSPHSIDQLASCHPDLARLFNDVVQNFDCSILQGHRGEDEQERAYAERKTQLHWPHGKHNSVPSRAVDVVPMPLPAWNDKAQFCFFAGYVLATAAKLGIPVRWGGDWNRDRILKNNQFDDLVHFELLGDVA